MVSQLQQSIALKYALVARRTGLRLRLLIAGWLLFITYLAWLAIRVGTLSGLFVTTATLFFFAIPGIFVGLTLFGSKVLRNPEGIIFGSVIGLAVSAYCTMAIGYLRGWSVIGMGGAVLVLTCITGAIYGFRTTPSPLQSRIREWTQADFWTLLVMWASVAGFVTYPYLNVGRQTQQGLAYSWLFGFDFLLRSAIASSMTLGLPPDYLHLAGEPLRYYLVSYSIPAFAYSASSKTVALHNILFLVQIAFSMLFLACIYAILRRFIRDRRALFCTSVAIVLSYSYYGWYVLAKSLLLHVGAPNFLPHSLLNFGDVSHLYQRLFLVEPQALTGLCVFLFVFFVLETIEYRLNDYSIALLLGLVVGIEFGIEGWQGLVLLSWVGSVYAWRWLRHRAFVRSELLPIIVALAGCAAIYSSFFLLGTYQLSSGKALLIKPYWWAMIASPIYFPVEYGPMFLLGLWGAWHAWKNERSRITAPVLLLLLITLVQIFFVTAEVLPEFGLLRGNRLLPIVLLIWTGFAFEKLFRDHARKRAPLFIGLVLLVLAVPTLITDIRATSNVEDVANTHYVRPADLQACDWIRQHLPESSIIQNEPDYIGQDSIPKHHNAIELSLIADFAERRMAVGELWIASTVIVNSKAIALQRYLAIHSMFRSSRASDVMKIADQYRIDYLYWGPYEQQLYPNFIAVLRSAPKIFTEVYDTKGVHIFKYNRKISTLQEALQQPQEENAHASRIAAAQSLVARQ